jgi:hypothetical protein
VTQALLSQRDAVHALFGETTGTIGEALQQVKDAVTQLVGAFSQSTEAGKILFTLIAGVAAQIRALANNKEAIDSFAKSTITFFDDTVVRGETVIQVLTEMAKPFVNLVSVPAAFAGTLSGGGSFTDAIHAALDPIQKELDGLPAFFDKLERLQSQKPVSALADAAKNAGPPALPELPGGTPAALHLVSQADADKAAKELAKLRGAFNSLLGTIDPVYAATIKYRDGVNLLADAIEKGIASPEQAQQVLAGPLLAD